MLSYRLIPSRLLIAAVFLIVSACAQGRGERCEKHTDCQEEYQCIKGGTASSGTCQPRDFTGVDAGAGQDAARDVAMSEDVAADSGDAAVEAGTSDGVSDAPPDDDADDSGAPDLSTTDVPSDLAGTDGANQPG